MTGGSIREHAAAVRKRYWHADQKGKGRILAQLAATTPMGRFGEPEELANAIVWLCRR